jgi:hypothetical protein
MYGVITGLAPTSDILFVPVDVLVIIVAAVVVDPV